MVLKGAKFSLILGMPNLLLDAVNQANMQIVMGKSSALARYNLILCVRLMRLLLGTRIKQLHFTRR